MLNATCHYAITDFDNALALAKQRLKESYVCTANYRVCNPGVSCLGGTCTDPPNIVSIACELALRRAMCAYHFPRCITDNIIFAHEVCMEQCDDVFAYCNITLDETVSVPKCASKGMYVHAYLVWVLRLCPCSIFFRFVVFWALLYLSTRAH